MVVTGLEQLAIRRVYASGGALDRAALRRGTIRWRGRPFSLIIPLASASVLVGAALVLSGGDRFGRFLAFPALVVAVSEGMLVRYGRDGSDDLKLVVLVGLIPGLLQARLAYLGLSLIAGQMMLSYLTAGLAKLCGTNWRAGRALLTILQTRDYGNERAAQLLANLPGAAVIDRSIIVLEVSAPLLLLWGGLTTLIACAVAALFHATTALVMRLNRFALWFIAGLPACLWCGQRVALGVYLAKH